jgi:LmbE family N-acetylglucosaminyl deacetylase
LKSGAAVWIKPAQIFYTNYFERRHAVKNRSIAFNTLFLLSAVISLLFLYGCSRLTSQAAVSVNCPAVPATSPQSPPPVACDNTALTGYDELLLIVPHPDDEVLGFAGLMQEFIRLGKKVSIVVVSIGDAYCDACSFWKNVGTISSMPEWKQCSEAELAQFATVRKGETRSGQVVLGGPVPTFWEYPDTGLGTSWDAISSGKDVDTKLRRSDCTKEGVFSKGGEIEMTPGILYKKLYDTISKASPKTLIGTTHPLDGHMDHKGLGNLIRKVNTDLAATGKIETAPKSVVFTVIHANSTPAGFPDHDAWFPSPAAVDGACFDVKKQSCYQKDTTLLGKMREYRFRPEWSSPMPQDAPYIASIPNAKVVPFCLPPAAYQGADASKLRAVNKFASQQGFLSLNGAIPPGMAGLSDCNGYQMGFIRSNEMFVLEAY